MSKKDSIEKTDKEIFMGYDTFEEARADSEYTSQAETLSHMLSRKNVFISGPPGSGKSEVVKTFINLTQEQYGDKVGIAITGTTGHVASMIGGATVHSWSGIGIDITPPKYSPDSVKNTDILIIDEISMLPSYYLDLIDKTCRKTKKNYNEPFGGIQVIFLGDFMQIPPVNNRDLPEEFDQRFVIHSEAWKEADLTYCYLDKVHRSKDPRLTRVLSDIENGTVTQETVDLLRARSINRIKPDPEKTYTMLYTVNKKVDKINEEELEKNPNPPKTFYRRIIKGKEGTPKEIDKAMKKVKHPEEITLKEGAKVMIIKNGNYPTVSTGGSNLKISGNKYATNGSVGTVYKLTSRQDSRDPGLQNAVLVKLNSGDIISVIKTEEETYQYKTTGRNEDGSPIVSKVLLLTVSHIPLKLASAITVHKSQGQTLDGAIVDLSKCFSPGMGYVALSRVRSLDDLIVEKMDKKAFIVDKSSREIAKDMKHDILEAKDARTDDDLTIMETVLTVPLARYTHWGDKVVLK